MKQKISIEKDGLPFIEADEKSVIFGFGEKSIEYSWLEIEEIIRTDYENYISYHLKEIK